MAEPARAISKRENSSTAETETCLPLKSTSLSLTSSRSSGGTCSAYLMTKRRLRSYGSDNTPELPLSCAAPHSSVTMTPAPNADIVRALISRTEEPFAAYGRVSQVSKCTLCIRPLPDRRALVLSTRHAPQD
jgi:hypothetical protein